MFDLEEYFRRTEPVQDLVGTRWLMGRVASINPKTYVEIGCGHLATFGLYESLLPPAPEGLAIGLDNNGHYWEGYKTISGCSHALIDGDSASDFVISEVARILGDRKIDFLFIDGDHDIAPVAADWKNYSPLVRSGGFVAFHDIDFDAFRRGETRGQGPAASVSELMSRGYAVEMSPGSIGIALVSI
jgi:hypothetical protein